MLRSVTYREKRKSRRFELNLPLEYRFMNSSDISAGMVVNGSEGGLFVRSIDNIPVGTKLVIAVLFPDDCELADFQALAEVVRTEGRQKGQIGYRYGLQLVQMNKEDYLKLQRLLDMQARRNPEDDIQDLADYGNINLKRRAFVP